MRNLPVPPQDGGLFYDLGALKRWFWFPLVTLGVAVIAAVAVGAMSPSSGRGALSAARRRRCAATVVRPARRPRPVRLRDPRDERPGGCRCFARYRRLARRAEAATDCRTAIQPAGDRFQGDRPERARHRAAWRDAMNEAARADTSSIELTLAHRTATNSTRRRRNSRRIRQQRAAAPAILPRNKNLRLRKRTTRPRPGCGSRTRSSLSTMKATSFVGDRPASRGVRRRLDGGTLRRGCRHRSARRRHRRARARALSRRSRPETPAVGGAPTEIPRVRSGSR